METINCTQPLGPKGQKVEGSKHTALQKGMNLGPTQGPILIFGGPQKGCSARAIMTKVFVCCMRTEGILWTPY